jgi:hypothetical protein
MRKLATLFLVVSRRDDAHRSDRLVQSRRTCFDDDFEQVYLNPQPLPISPRSAPDLDRSIARAQKLRYWLAYLPLTSKKLVNEQP